MLVISKQLVRVAALLRRMKDTLPEPPAKNGSDDALSSDDLSLSREISNLTAAVSHVLETIIDHRRSDRR
jgi:hypothetical protein